MQLLSIINSFAQDEKYKSIDSATAANKLVHLTASFINSLRLQLAFLSLSLAPFVSSLHLHSILVIAFTALLIYGGD